MAKGRKMADNCSEGIMSQPMPVESEKLKLVLDEKIERMNGEQLTLVSQVLLQVEAEELANRLNEAFDKDREQGRLRRIPSW